MPLGSRVPLGSRAAPGVPGSPGGHHFIESVDEGLIDDEIPRRVANQVLDAPGQGLIRRIDGDVQHEQHASRVHDRPQPGREVALLLDLEEPSESGVVQCRDYLAGQVPACVLEDREENVQVRALAEVALLEEAPQLGGSPGGIGLPLTKYAVHIGSYLLE